jgi:protoporphyrinogen oxidase
MESVRHLVIGAGISGLATAAFLEDDDTLVIEGDREIGGYCKTVKKQGFTWDYSGHFFHFKHPEIEAWLRERMPGQTIRSVEKKSFIAYGADGRRLIDFPFQKNIHQLPQAEFIECLHDLYFASGSERGKPGSGSPGSSPEPPESFAEMLYARFGRGIAEKFLIPYNEKLYATDLRALDKDAMGRFFPHANLTEIVRNMKTPDNASYNATFTYPEGGAIEYVKALASAVEARKPGRIALEEKLVAIDLRNRVATTNKRELRFERLVSSAPFNVLAAMSGIKHDPSVFSWNKVLVFNLGFDKKAATGRHWVYFPDRGVSFYRIGYYDNIFDTDRASLYVELGFARDAVLDRREIDRLRGVVLEDLRKQGVIADHELVAHHDVVMDPAYVHITRASMAEHARVSRILRAHGVYAVGRYGGWTYCSIEDNIVEARALTTKWAGAA